MGAIVLDTETTGLDKEKDRIVEIGIVGYEDESLEIVQRLDPGIPIPPEVSAIHGIYDRDVEGMPTFEHFFIGIRQLIEQADAVIGQNIFYDQGMIDGECARYGFLPVRWPTLVCTKRTWDVFEPREERHLQNAYRRFVDRKGFDNAHSALADVRATRAVMRGQIEAFGLHHYSWESLDPERKLWFGPSSHILLLENGDLVMNFGKNRGKLVATIDDGFWKWLQTKDFEHHVQMVSIMAQEFLRQSPLVSERAQLLTAWARQYKRDKWPAT